MQIFLHLLFAMVLCTWYSISDELGDRHNLITLGMKSLENYSCSMGCT